MSDENTVSNVNVTHYTVVNCTTLKTREKIQYDPYTIPVEKNTNLTKNPPPLIQ